MNFFTISIAQLIQCSAFANYYWLLLIMHTLKTHLKLVPIKKCLLLISSGWNIPSFGGLCGVSEDGNIEGVSF